ncbi:MAG: DUF1428 domain-containing protein [Sphingobium sp.]|jgi:uncharacterized protein YbaA (DUF1428 family)|nr:MAG: DUF1428 domain-containing protein [Sphingobium sp.]
MTYVDGFVIPVPGGNRQAYKDMAEKAAAIWIEHGATRIVETWNDDIKPGKVNDFRTAVIAEDGEEVVFSWVEWPSREARDIGNEKIMNDPRMKPEEGEGMPFSGARLIFGGFTTMVDRKG